MVLHGIVMDAGKESQADRVVKFYAKVTARTAAKTAPPRRAPPSPHCFGRERAGVLLLACREQKTVVEAELRRGRD